MFELAADALDGLARKLQYPIYRLVVLAILAAPVPERFNRGTGND
jgi:hypothetical protein